MLASLYCGDGPGTTSRNNAFVGFPVYKLWYSSYKYHSPKAIHLSSAVVNKAINASLRYEIEVSIEEKLDNLSEE